MILSTDVNFDKGLSSSHWLSAFKQLRVSEVSKKRQMVGGSTALMTKLLLLIEH